MITYPKSIVNIDELTFETDDEQGLGLSNGEPFEPEVLFALKKLIRPDSLVLDLGANVGYFTAHMSKMVGARGSVHAFEPEPRNFYLLGQNIKRNNLENVTIHQVALGDREEIKNLHISDFSGGMHRLYDSTCCGREIVRVPVRRLDSIFEPDQISVMKIDVEGYEPFVLLGAEKIIRNQDVDIITEYCPPAMLEAGASLASYLDYMENCGFMAYEPDGKIICWQNLVDDAIKWERFGRDELISTCKGKSNPEIAEFVERKSLQLNCRRPYIENLIFKSH